MLFQGFDMAFAEPQQPTEKLCVFQYEEHYYMQLWRNGKMTEERKSQFKCTEHAEAEAMSVWPGVSVLNDQLVKSDNELDLLAANMLSVLDK